MEKSVSQISRETILQESLKQFLQHGYHNVSLNKIVKSIDVSKGRLTHHFPSKELLLKASLDYFFSQLASLPQPSPPSSLKDTIRLLFNGVIDINTSLSKITGVDDTGLNYHRLFLDSKMVLEGNSLIDSYFRLPLLQLDQMIEDAKSKSEIKTDLDSSAVAYQILATVEGMYILSYYTGFPEDNVMNDIVENLFRGLKA